jgi:hypothetical protein
VSEVTKGVADVSRRGVAIAVQMLTELEWNDEGASCVQEWCAAFSFSHLQPFCSPGGLCGIAAVGFRGVLGPNQGLT